MDNHLDIATEVSDDSKESIQSKIPDISDCIIDGKITNLHLLEELHVTPDEFYDYIISNNIKVTDFSPLTEHIDYCIHQYVSAQFVILMDTDQVKAREFATIHSRQLIDEYYGSTFEIIDDDVLEILLPFMTEKDIRNLGGYGYRIEKNDREDLTISDIIAFFDRFPRIFKVLSRNS